MPATLPYLSTPGTIDTAFAKIKHAATPTRFTNDFVTTVLQIKGGTGKAIPPFLKKLGLLNPDGTPNALYDRLRNDASSKSAVADAMRIAYKPLFDVNEYAYNLSDTDLKGLLLQVTGAKKGDRVADLIYLTFKKLKSHAAFDGASRTPAAKQDERPDEATGASLRDSGSRAWAREGLGLTYTITLNLPASTNIEVFNAIFRNLRENLLRD
jgi:hypothetical protein